MSGCKMLFSDAAQAIQAELTGSNAEFDGVSTDSRSVRPGQLFVALKGPNFDGHEYVGQAIKSGAAGAMVETRLDINAPQLIVGNCLKALGQLGSYWRRHLGLPIVAVTGSNGKTTVKEMIAAILSQTGEIYATRGNLNNDIGVPLTLLSLEPKHKAAVVEMGANHPGEISYLTRLTRPNVEGFGSLQGVANAKGEIFEGLPVNGVAVINADDPFSGLWHGLASSNKVMTFGLENTADVTCEWQWTREGMGITVTTPGGEFSVQLSVIGKHNVMNALAAIAASLALNTPLAAIEAGLQAVQAVPGRLQLKKGVKQSLLIDDTYNANPSSLKAALGVLAHYEGKTIVALGDMGELGEGAQQLHREAGEQCREFNISQLCAVGENSRCAVQSFGSGGHYFESHEGMITYLEKQLDKNSILLIKGSRSMRMERIVNALTVKPKEGI
jgi:UDP-N-acetylmuramoyl-tripeptide--D-alanyl-D-alanine ligase